jgi:hypothetical protein
MPTLEDFKFEKAVIKKITGRRIFLRYKDGLVGETRLVKHVSKSQISEFEGLTADVLVAQGIGELCGVYRNGIGVIADNTEKYRENQSMPDELVDNIKGKLYSGPQE